MENIELFQKNGDFYKSPWLRSRQGKLQNKHSVQEVMYILSEYPIKISQGFLDMQYFDFTPRLW